MAGEAVHENNRDADTTTAAATTKEINREGTRSGFCFRRAWPDQGRCGRPDDLRPGTGARRDTVLVNGVRVRLKGIDAAERGSARGEAARLAMIKIAGTHLSCDLTGEKTHRREVGFCFNNDGDDISEKLIAEGMALACPPILDSYIEVETAEARAAQIRATYCLKKGR